MSEAPLLSTPARLQLGWLENESILDNPLGSWALAIGAFVLSIFLFSSLRSLVVRRARKGSQRSGPFLRRIVLDLASAVSWLAVIAVSLSVGLLFVDLGDGRANDVAHWTLVLAVAWQAAVWIGILLEALLTLAIESRVSGDSQDDQPLVASMGVFRFLGKLVAYSLVALVALDNLGTDVTALLAGLGVGGIAIALAVQSIVGDLFSSMSITLDKPFVVGDFIVIGDKMGTVENVGIKTTRLRSLGGEQIVIGNSDLLNSRIQNFKRMRERRIVFGIGVVYGTPREQVARIPEILRESVEAQKGTRFDRAHFKAFGAYSLDFEVVYFVLSPDFNVYMDVQQAINLEVLKVFEEEGIEFAFPTQTLFIERDGGDESRETPAAAVP